MLLDAVKRRLRADVPVVSYISGGVDSSVVVAMASKVRGTPIPSFTIRIKDRKLDESTEASVDGPARRREADRRRLSAPTRC